MSIHRINVSNDVRATLVTPGKPDRVLPTTVVSRKDSQGNVHRVHFIKGQEFGMDRLFGQDSVQVTHDGRFKIGDRVRPTKEFIDEVLHGSIPYEMLANWSKGFRITEIGPVDMPWKGEHAIEIGDGGDDIYGLCMCYIEKV